MPAILLNSIIIIANELAKLSCFGGAIVFGRA
jgi:hypothetical protein